MFQSVGPAGATGGHAGIVVEAVSVQHVEHSVSADSEEGSPHALDVLGIDTGVSNQHLGFADDFIGPLLLVEVGSVAVRNGVRGDLVTVGVEILNLRVVSPLVRNIKGRLKLRDKEIISFKLEKYKTSVPTMIPSAGPTIPPVGFARF